MFDFDDILSRSVHIDRVLHFTSAYKWTATLKPFFECLSLQGQVEAIASFIGEGSIQVSFVANESLYLEDLVEIPLPDLTRRYLATFPLSELEDDDDFRLEELVLRGLTLATGYKPINWPARNTRIRIWLMLAAAKLKLMAIRARKRTWKPDSVAVKRLATIYGMRKKRSLERMCD